MEMNWLEITVLVLIGLAAISFIVIEILRLIGKLSKEDADNAEGWIAKWVSIAVYAAEQIYGAKTGEIKLQYVERILALLGIEFTEPVRAMVEAAVFNLQQKTAKA